MNDTLRTQFDVGKACEELREVNKSPSFVASDFLTAREFKPYEALPEGEAACGVVIIDGLWRAGVARGRDGLEELDRMICLYEQNRSDYGGCLDRLRPLSLETEEDRDAIFKIASDMLRTLLGASGRLNYSFATKLFHWHAPDHLPIVDSRAGKAIDDLRRKCGTDRERLKPDFSDANDASKIERRLSNYRLWIDFYSDLIRALKRRGDDRLLLDADRESLKSLAPEFYMENTLLRVLDKVFWHGGKGGATVSAPTSESGGYKSAPTDSNQDDRQ